MTTVTSAALTGGLIVGACAVPVLVSRGRDQLKLPSVGPSVMMLGAILGGGSGAAVVAVQAGHHRWNFAPAMIAWAAALLALAICDAGSLRIPTPLARHATALTAVLLVCGAFIGGNWIVPSVASFASAVASGVFLTAWRFLGAGFGDIRLAALGGLGLGDVSLNSLTVGLLVWTAVLAVQTGAVFGRGLPARTHVPLGPGLAAGFLTAAFLSA